MKAAIFAIFSTLAQAGECPSYTLNRDPLTFNQSQISGLWYEYLSTPSYSQGAYDCATWNLLGSVNETTQHASFDVVHLAKKQDVDKSDFGMNRLDCGKNGTADSVKCTLLQRKQVDSKIEEDTSTFQIVATDKFSYLVGSIYKDCGDLDYIVMTREKSPSKYARTKILDALKTQIGMKKEDISGLFKYQPHACWGDDMYL